jgi:alpha-galactosidase
MTEWRHSFIFDAESGTFAVRAGDLGFSGASAQALVTDHALDSVFLDVADVRREPAERPGLGPGTVETIRFEPEDDLSLALEAFTPQSGACVVLRLLLTNGQAAPLAVDELQPLVLEGEAGELALDASSDDWVMYREGWHSWAPSGVRRLGDDDYRVGGTLPGSIVSNRVAVIVARQTQRGVLLGYLAEKHLRGTFVVSRHGAAIRASAEADGVALAPGAALATEPLMIRFTGAPLTALEHYGDLFAAAMGSRLTSRAAATLPAVSGWLSWYTNHQVSDQMLRENLARYTPEAGRWKLDYWVIDDGWQSVAGDWLDVNTKKFPRGMKLVADGIRAAGLKPGLWIAPFMVSEASILAREHPDWLLKNAEGQPVVSFRMPEESHWRGRQFVLDVTHPDAAEYVRRVLRTIVREWGYAYIKTDFVFVTALRGVRHDATLTRTEVMHRAMQLLRDEVGQRFLLACGCPIGAAVGTADSCRTSPDVADFWDQPELDAGSPAVANAVRNIIARYWQHGRFFLADPDALMVRDVETRLTLDEVETLATVVAMSGGLMMWSDVLDSVSDERRMILDKVLPVHPVAAQPVHLFRSEVMQSLVWSLEQGGERWRVVALLNLSDHMADLSLRLADVGCPRGLRHHVFEFWRQEYLGSLDGTLTVGAVPAHGVRLLVIREETAGLDFLGSTLHVTAGAALCRVTPKGLTCQVQLDTSWPRRGRLYFHAPAGYAVRTADGLLTAHEGGAWSIEVDTTMASEYHFEAVRDS